VDVEGDLEKSMRAWMEDQTSVREISEIDGKISDVLKQISESLKKLEYVNGLAHSPLVGLCQSVASGIH
jgi:hypothetical protein